MRRPARRAPAPRRPHRGQRGREAGEQRELQRRLLHQQVQPRDQHAVRGGRRERGRPRLVEHLEDHGYGGAAVHEGRVLGHGRDGGDDHVSRDAGVEPGHLDLRRTRVGVQRRDRLRRPVGGPHEQPHPVGAEVAQRQPGRGGGRAAPEDRGRPDRGDPALGQRRPRTADVGVVGRPPAVVVTHERVGRPREAGAGREAVRQRHHLALQRHRQREPPPLLPERAHQVAERAGGHAQRVVLPVEARRDVPGPVQHRGQRVADGVAQHAAPTTARHQQASDSLAQ